MLQTKIDFNAIEGLCMHWFPVNKLDITVNFQEEKALDMTLKIEKIADNSEGRTEVNGLESMSVIWKD